VAVGDVVEPLGNVITVLLGDAIALRGYLAPGGVVAVGDGLYSISTWNTEQLWCDMSPKTEF
jgi:hypothetical protein